MEINLGNERIVQLSAAFSSTEIQEAAVRKRVDAFGQVARFFQRPKPDDISIVGTQLRFEPFWYASAAARYRYDRLHTYRVPTTPEVHSVTVYENELSVATQGNRTFDLQALEHCVEEPRASLALDGLTGAELPTEKYLSHTQVEVPDVKELGADGALVVAPEVRGSFLVRKLVSMLMRTFQADKINEERIDVEEVVLVFCPIYVVDYVWQAKDKRQTLLFDGLTGDSRTPPSGAMRSIAKVLDNDALFDIGADTIGAVVPGANIAIKLGRLAARRVIQ
jgi:hypothetical protein